MGVTDPHPGNVVEVVVGPHANWQQVVRAARIGQLRPGEREWFRATLPAVRAGRSLTYYIQLRRAGQRLAQLPADGSWFTITGAEDRADGPSSEKHPLLDAGTPGTPRWATGLTFFASLTARLRTEIIGETAEGYRVNFFVVDGVVRGSQIEAQVRPEGGDSFCVRRDGTGAISIDITYETAGGALIVERASGMVDLGATGYDDAVSGRWLGLGTPRLYATPTWATSDPAWRWLNRRQGFAFGKVLLNKAQVELARFQVEWDIYFPEVGDGPVDG